MFLFNLPNPLIKVIFKFVDLESRYQLRYVNKKFNIPLPSIEDLYQFMRNIDDKIRIRYINDGCNGCNTTGLLDIQKQTHIDYENIRKSDVDVYEQLVHDLKNINGVPEHPIINPKDIDLDMSEFLPMLKQSYFSYRFVLCCHEGNYKSSYCSFRFNIGSRNWDSEIQIDDYFEGDEEHLPRFNPWEWIDLVNFDAEEDSEMWLINCCKESEYYGRIYRFEHQRGDKAREFEGVSLKSFIYDFPLYLKNKRCYRQYIKRSKIDK